MPRLLRQMGIKQREGLTMARTIRIPHRMLKGMLVDLIKVLKIQTTGKVLIPKTMIMDVQLGPRISRNQIQIQLVMVTLLSLTKMEKMKGSL